MVVEKVVDGYILILLVMQVDLVEAVDAVDHPLMVDLTVVVGVILHLQLTITFLQPIKLLKVLMEEVEH